MEEKNILGAGNRIEPGLWQRFKTWCAGRNIKMQDALEIAIKKLMKEK